MRFHQTVTIPWRWLSLQALFWVRGTRARFMSACPPIAALEQTSPKVRVGPKADSAHLQCH